MVSDQDLVLGEAHLALNDCESAKADFEKTFQLDPENKVLVLFFSLEVNFKVFTINKKLNRVSEATPCSIIFGNR